MLSGESSQLEPRKIALCDYRHLPNFLLHLCSVTRNSPPKHPLRGSPPTAARWRHAPQHHGAQLPGRLTGTPGAARWGASPLQLRALAPRLVLRWRPSGHWPDRLRAHAGEAHHRSALPLWPLPPQPPLRWQPRRPPSPLVVVLSLEARPKIIGCFPPISQGLPQW